MIAAQLGYLCRNRLREAPFLTANTFTYYAGAVRLTETAAPNTKNKSNTIAAEIVMPMSGGEGVIVAEGGSSAGFALYVQGGKLVYEYNWFDEDRYIITSSEPVPAGKSAVRFEFAYDGGEGKGGKVRYSSTARRSERGASRKLSLPVSESTPSVSAWIPVHPFQIPTNRRLPSTERSRRLRSICDERLGHGVEHPDGLEG